MNSQRLKRSGLLVAALAVGGVVVFVILTRLIAFESHRGFFAATWDPAGNQVYFVERRTVGVTWGLGWEHFTPPASAHVLRDTVQLMRLDPGSGTVDALTERISTPLVGRTVHTYRGRLFTILRAAIEPDRTGFNYKIAFSVPVVPTSQTYLLKGRWPGANAASGVWSVNSGEMVSPSENILVAGRELITPKGRESFPPAIVSVDPNGSYEVLLKTASFDRIYPDGLPGKLIADTSRRESITRVRTFRRVHGELKDQFKAQGLNDGAASLRAYDRMEDMGLLPKDPQLVATPVASAPQGVPVFAISEEEFAVGLFRDIANAIAAPGTEVDKSMGRYIVHRDYDTSHRLNAWLDMSPDAFAVDHDSRLYLVEIRRYDR